MKRRSRRGSGVFFFAFGAGLLTATLCPPKVMLILAAIALVLMGCSYGKN